MDATQLKAKNCTFKKKTKLLSFGFHFERKIYL